VSFRVGTILRGDSCSDLENCILSLMANRHIRQMDSDIDAADVAESIARMRKGGGEFPWENCLPEIKWWR
jgi:hypothetical protein